MSRGKSIAANRVFIRLVAAAQLNWVEFKLICKFIDRTFERKGANGFAGSTHESVGQHVQFGNALRQTKVPGAIEMPCRKAELLGTIVVRRHRDDPFVD